MKLLSKIKRLSRRSVAVAAVTVALLGAGLLTTTMGAHAATTCPGFDGDVNAVVWCGANTSGSKASPSEITMRYNKGDGHNSATAIQHVYGSKSFNISSSDIQNLSKNAQLGSVTSGGDVMLNGKVVATDAITAGRKPINNSKGKSTFHNNGGTIFYTRKPAVSFVSSPLSAYVVMQNGQFKFAILLSCGNPVVGTPPKKPTPPPAKKKPNYTINKQVAVKGDTTFGKSVSVKPGTHVIYKITVDSTGNAPITDLKVKDTLPKDVQFVAGTLQEDGKTANSSNFFGNGITISSLKNGSSTVFTFEAIVGPKDTVESCTPETLNNIGSMTATSLPGKSSTATVGKTCLPQPVYACTSLTPFANSRDEFTFTAKASASNGATISAYDFSFGDNTSKNVITAAETTTAQHTYGAPGTYDASVTVTVKLPDGTTKIVTAPSCTAKVTVTQPPAAECTNLTLTQDANNPRQVSATAVFTTSNGAKLTGASFNWGDGVTTPSSMQTTASHTYQQDGSFTVIATLTFSATSGTVPNSNCQAPITVTTVMPTCNNLTVDVNNDDKTVTISSLDFTSNNGTYQFTSLDWGDSTTPVTASDITGQSHTYSANGPFTIVATPHFMVNGQDTPITSDSCKKQVSFTTTPTPPTTPPTTPPVTTPPTQLVNTGAGSVVGLFGGAVLIGTFGYRWFLGRRLGRES